MFFVTVTTTSWKYVLAAFLTTYSVGISFSAFAANQESQTSSPPKAKTVTVMCDVCDNIEKYGDEILSDIKRMPLKDLTKRDKDGCTPYFFALITPNATEIERYLRSKLKPSELFDDKMAKVFFSFCSAHISCSSGYIKSVASMGYVPSVESLVSAVAYSDGGLEKFHVLKRAGAKPFSVGSEKDNFLHLLVARSAVGRLPVTRENLAAAITETITENPELKLEKNSKNMTPLELAHHLQNSPDQWGSNITKSSFDLVISALSR